MVQNNQQHSNRLININLLIENNCIDLSKILNIISSNQSVYLLTQEYQLKLNVNLNNIKTEDSDQIILNNNIIYQIELMTKSGDVLIAIPKIIDNTIIAYYKGIFYKNKNSDNLYSAIEHGNFDINLNCEHLSKNAIVYQDNNNNYLLQIHIDDIIFDGLLDTNTYFFLNDVIVACTRKNSDEAYYIAFNDNFNQENLSQIKITDLSVNYKIYQCIQVGEFFYLHDETEVTHCWDKYQNQFVKYDTPLLIKSIIPDELLKHKSIPIKYISKDLTIINKILDVSHKDINTIDQNLITCNYLSHIGIDPQNTSIILLLNLFSSVKLIILIDYIESLIKQYSSSSDMKLLDIKLLLPILKLLTQSDYVKIENDANVNSTSNNCIDNFMSLQYDLQFYEIIKNFMTYLFGIDKHIYNLRNGKKTFTLDIIKRHDLDSYGVITNQVYDAYVVLNQCVSLKDLSLDFLDLNLQVNDVLLPNNVIASTKTQEILITGRMVEYVVDINNIDILFVINNIATVVNIKKLLNNTDYRISKLLLIDSSDPKNINKMLNIVVHLNGTASILLHSSTHNLHNINQYATDNNVSDDEINNSLSLNKNDVDLLLSTGVISVNDLKYQINAFSYSKKNFLS